MTDRLKVAVLVDLPREKASGGHVKYWERVAQAAVKSCGGIDLTIYFSGDAGEEILSPNVRYRFLPPVFSTSNLKFLPYVPAHTDLASFHPALAQELSNYDVIHTTDACFAFARTAERIARWTHIPLVTSFHTDTPAYTEIFTRQTLEHLLGHKAGRFFADSLGIAALQRILKARRLKTHLKKCAAIMAMRDEDIALVQGIGAQDKIKPMHLGVDKSLFSPQFADRPGIEGDYTIPPGKFLTLFVGRIDAGKNVLVLAQACARAIAQGAPLHLILAGLGPLSGKVKDILGDNATLAGWVEPENLPRFYASVDCLAIASDVEIGGMIGIEAVASGCPVLVSRQSRVAQICGALHAMHMVESGVEPWTQELYDLAQNPAQQQTMRAAALDFRRDNLAGWDDVLKYDFIPVWQAVARKE